MVSRQGPASRSAAFRKIAVRLLSEVLDNVVLNLVEIILDLGTILNGLPEAIVGTAGESSGEIFLQCFNH